jgi:hypothetical protein
VRSARKPSSSSAAVMVSQLSGVLAVVLSVAVMLSRTSSLALSTDSGYDPVDRLRHSGCLGRVSPPVPEGGAAGAQ